MAGMSVGEFQSMVLAFDTARGWEEVSEVHIGLHICEEAGEVARALLARASYKETGDNLSSEISDLIILLAKLSNTAGINLESALAEKLQQLEIRFPIEESQAAMAVYLKKSEKSGSKKRD